jgi:cytochrome oxidase assembly protein ShyY1
VNLNNQSTVRSSFTANRKLTLFTLLALPLLLSLGFWQLDRAAEKRALEAAYVEQQAQPPSQLDAHNMASLPDHRRVLLQGQFDADHTWLLDNKQRDGRVGYEVVTPFKLTDGSLILVNRGWLPGSRQRAQLPPIPALSGEQMLFGELVSASKHPLLDGATTQTDWPRVVMALDPVAMSEQLGKVLPARYLRLDDSSPGALVTQWQAVNVSSAKHSGYAFQWFGMALALVIWFIVANTKVLHTWRRPPSQNP